MAHTSLDEMKNSFPIYFSTAVCKVKIVPKSKSWLMKVIAGILWLSNKLRITDIQGFMTEYATTLHGVIYWPDPCEGMNTKPGGRLYHELTHVLEWRARPLTYDIGYVVSKEKRAFYETTCVQAEMLMDPRKATQSHVVSRIPQFVNYGIPKDIVRRHLNARLVEIGENKPQPEAKEVADSYAEWRNMST